MVMDCPAKASVWGIGWHGHYAQVQQSLFSWKEQGDIILYREETRASAPRRRTPRSKTE